MLGAVETSTPAAASSYNAALHLARVPLRPHLPDPRHQRSGAAPRTSSRDDPVPPALPGHPHVLARADELDAAAPGRRRPRQARQVGVARRDHRRERARVLDPPVLLVVARRHDLHVPAERPVDRGLVPRKCCASCVVNEQLITSYPWSIPQCSAATTKCDEPDRAADHLHAVDRRRRRTAGRSTRRPCRGRRRPRRRRRSAAASAVRARLGLDR